MKKSLLFIFVLVLCVLLCSCNGSKSDIIESSTEIESTEPSVENLTKATELIKDAEDLIIKAASQQLSGWINDAEVMRAYFVDDMYDSLSHYTEDYGLPEYPNRAESIHEFRADAQEKLESAKELIGKNGSEDYYNAVKEYYKTVNNFLTLISEFPDGYSKFTYSNTVTDHKSDCADAYSELEFYR